MKALAAIVVACVALAGCASEPGFDGQSAWDRMESVVYESPGELRALVPGDPGHTQAAEWLLGEMTVTGWSARNDPFTGSDYQALDKGDAGRWANSCSQEDAEELPDLQFMNLYATRPGNGPGHVVLAAHWDGKEEASEDPDGTKRMQPVPAANDGAAGVGLLLEMQHHIENEGIRLPFDLTIAFFDGEDGFEDCHPLAGSIYAARNARLGDISQLILLDMIGDEDARFIREGRSVSSAPDVVDLIWSKAADHGLQENFVSTSRTIADDHLPFIEEGIAAVDIIDAGRTGTFPPYWHTSEDTPDKISPDMLARMGDLLLDVLSDPGFAALQQ